MKKLIMMCTAVLVTFCVQSGVLSNYGPFVPGKAVELDPEPELVGYSAKKLPSGMKLDKKTGTVKGKPKKPGTYTVTFTKKNSETRTATFEVGPMPTITIAMEGGTAKCKVTGASKPGKGYLFGQKVNLSAKCPKGITFAGWFTEHGKPWPNGTEYLNAKYKHVMTDESLSLVARFENEKATKNAANKYFVESIDNDEGEKYSLTAGITNIGDFLPSLKLNSSTAKLKVSGLPAGLKYDAKTCKITGIAKKAGVYTVSLTVTDGKQKYVSTMTIEVKALPSWVVGKFYGYYNNYADSWPMLWELSVSKLGKVVLKNVECDGEAMNLPVSGLKMSTCKTFCHNGDGTFDYVDCDVYSFNVDSTSDLDVEGEFMICDNHRRSDQYVCNCLKSFDGYIEGKDEEGNEISVDMEFYQDTYASKPEGIVLPVFKSKCNNFIFEETVEFKYLDGTANVDVKLGMKFGANGNVKVSWLGDGKFKMFPAHLTPYYVEDDGTVFANLSVMGGLGTGDWYGFYINMDLEIPCDGKNIADVDSIKTCIYASFIDKE